MVMFFSLFYSVNLNFKTPTHLTDYGMLFVNEI
jgi:hypothetical protein